MNIRRKIWLDKTLGRTGALVLNLCARVLSTALRREHILHPGLRRIAVCKIMGMGSIIQMTPLLRTMKMSFPDARLVFVTSEVHRPLVRRFGLVDEILTVDDRGPIPLFFTTLATVFRLWRFRADLYIDVEMFSHFSSILSILSCARNRIGYFKSSFAYRLGLFNYLLYFNMKARVSEVFLQIARLTGCGVIVSELAPLSAGPDDWEELRRRAPFSLDTRYLVINPNASDLRLERRWDGGGFAALIARIAREYPDRRIVLVGSKAEARYVDTVLAGVPQTERRNVVDLSGQLSLGALIALIEKAELLITNDTGPMHIAFALRKTVVALWGPGHPLLYGSFPNVLSIYKNLYCSPCIYEFDIPPCRGDNQCMKAIGVDDVFAAVRRVVSGGEREFTFEPGPMVFTGIDGRSPLGVVINLRVRS